MTAEWDGDAHDYDTTVCSYTVIPDALTGREQWVCWQYEERTDADGEPYFTKIPINAETGSRADATDPDDWTSYERACEYDRQHSQIDGVGYCFDENNPLVGFDFDNAYDPETGQWEPWALDFIQRLDSYTEFSPSGTGGHTWVWGEKPGDDCKTAMESTLDAYDNADIEIYDRDRFLTVTGDHVEWTPETVDDRDSVVTEIYEEVFGSSDDEPDVVTDEQVSEIHDDVREQLEAEQSSSGGNNPDLDDETVIELAKNAKNGNDFAALYDGSIVGYPSHSEARMALLFHLAFWTGKNRAQMNRLYRESGLYDAGETEKGETYPDKWDRLGDDEISTAIQKTSDTYSGAGAVADGSGRAFAAAKDELGDELDALGTRAHQEEDRLVEAFAREFAGEFVGGGRELSRTAQLIADTSSYNKTDAKHALEEWAIEATGTSEDTPTLDGFLETNVVRLIKQKTRDHVQEATLFFEFDGGKYVKTSATGRGKTHNSSPDFRDEIQGKLDVRPPKPSPQLRDPAAWREWVNGFIDRREEIEHYDGPRTRAVKTLRREIGRSTAYTEDINGATAEAGYANRGGVFVPDDSDFMLVPNGIPQNAARSEDIRVNALQFEMNARGHTDQDGGISVVRRTDDGPRRFWKIDDDFATPNEYRAEPRQNNRSDDGEEGESHVDLTETIDHGVLSDTDEE